LIRPKPTRVAVPIEEEEEWGFTKFELQPIELLDTLGGS
jgi:hypothetical protein